MEPPIGLGSGIAATNAMQSRSEIRDELEQRIANGQLVSCPVREEPLPIVVGAQVARESKQR